MEQKLKDLPLRDFVAVAKVVVEKNKDSAIAAKAMNLPVVAARLELSAEVIETLLVFFDDLILKPKAYAENVHAALQRTVDEHNKPKD